jgi:branched-chain amino acid transport system substrate-binding protein
MKVQAKTLMVALGAAAAYVGLSFAATGARAQDTIKIGMTSALTGPYNEYGEGAHRGIELAIEKWNAKGGINGKKIELSMLLDDQLVPDRAVQNMRRLLDNKDLVAIIGPAGTGPTLAVIDMAQLDGRPYMNPIAQTPSITYPQEGKPRPNVFSFGLQNDVEMKMQAQYVVSKGFKKIGLLHESTAAGISAAQVVTAELKAEGKDPPVADESYNQKTQDMTAQIARLQRAGADVIIYTGLGADLAVARKTMARLNWTVPLLANNASLSPPYEEGAGDLVVGTLGSMIAAFGRDPLNPVAQEFADAYKAKYGADRWWGSDPSRPQLSMSLTVANAYDAGMVLFEGIRRANSTDAKAIDKAIEGIKGYQGVNALYSFSPEKHHGVTEKDLAIFDYEKVGGKIKLQLAKD